MENRELRNEPIDIGQVLADIEPWAYTVNGLPVKEIEYSQNRVTIRWFSEEELERQKTMASDRDNILQAPWSLEEVSKLNNYQWCGKYHQYTCKDSWHRPLIATTEGWICLDCSYKQHWAHKGSLDV